jgi:hypothetical protein
MSERPKGICFDCGIETHSTEATRCRSCYLTDRWKRPDFETQEEFEEDTRKRRKASREKYIYKKLYNLTENDYQDMLKEQNYSCAICGVHQDTLDVRMNVDHDHSCCPGKYTCGNCIRGLLCRTCNMALGGFKDSENILKSALQYITSYSKEPR